jgi:hypothetical protein
MMTSSTSGFKELKMDVKVLGTGCAKCKKLYAEAQKAIDASGVVASLSKVEKIDEIMKFGVLMAR